MKKKIVQQVIDAYGGVEAVMARFGYTERSAVHNWKARGLPKDKIAYIHIDTKIPVEKLLAG